MKRFNNKGFSISVLIYGIFMMFIILLCALIVVMNYRKKIFLNISIPSVESNSSSEEEQKSFEVKILEKDLDGLIPIKYVDSDGNVAKERGTGKWVITSIDDPDWFDYNDGRWANAVHLLKNYPDSKELGEELNTSYVRYYYVWIPKFEYTIGCNGSLDKCFGYDNKIDINFVPKDKKNNNDEFFPRYIYKNYGHYPNNWYVHPAFDSDKSGFWVGKYDLVMIYDKNCYKLKETEDSKTCNSSTKYIYGNNDSVNGAHRNIGTGITVYNRIPGNWLISNSEWAAVEYLEHSYFGTNGNVYRVFSVNHCDAWHYVLGFFENLASDWKTFTSSSKYNENIENMDVFNIFNSSDKISDKVSKIKSENLELIGQGFFEIIPFNTNAYNANGKCTDFTQSNGQVVTTCSPHFPLVLRKYNFAFSFADDSGNWGLVDDELHFTIVKK